LKTIKPTESELAILKIIWDHGACTVRHIHEILTENNREVGYTTTLKLMQIMHGKGLLERDESSKTHVYKALVSRDQAEQHLLGRMINDVFDGSAARLVMQALGNHRASEEEIEKIKQLLDDLEHKK